MEQTGPKVIIVGSGHGLRVHLPALRETGFEVVALVGRDPERTQRRAERHQIPDAFTNLGQAISATGAVAVTIASTPTNHGVMVREAIQHGCHVMCEKPFAANAQEAAAIVSEADQTGVLHIMGNQLRANPERIVAAKAIADGVLGEPRYLTFVQHTNLLSNTAVKWPDWWFDEAAGGGWLGASGSHMIDHIRSWLGDFASVSAALPVVADRENVTEDSFNVRFRMVNGVEGVFTQTGAAWGPMAQMTRVAGSHGTLWLEDGQVWLADKDGTRNIEVPESLKLLEMQPSDDPRERYLHVELPPTLKLFAIWRQAIEAKQAGKVVSIEPFASFHDGLAAMRVIDAVRRSAANDGERVVVES